MDQNWIRDVKTQTLNFLEQMKGRQRPGFFRYSYSGDLFNEHKHWGLGNTVFAIKSYFALGELDRLSPEQKTALLNFIKSFQCANGMFCDPLVAQRAWWREKFSAIRNRSFGNFFHKQTKIAETRQAISALTLLREKPTRLPAIPSSRQAINHYLERLPWHTPWNAGSHFSHLLFFLTHSDLKEKETLVQQAIDWVQRLQQSDGAWYTGHPSRAQKINGAMKVLTGLHVANQMKFDRAEALVDLALSSTHDRHACDNFNVIYVLKYANRALAGMYRSEEIKTFAREKLETYQTHYWPAIGGFSFFPKRANDRYYHAKMTKGLPEPDLHGTVLFLWGLSLIGQILEDDQFDFHEFIT